MKPCISPRAPTKCFDERFNEKGRVARLMATEMNKGTGPLMSTDALKWIELGMQAVLISEMSNALHSSVREGRLNKCPSAPFLEC